MSDHTCTLKELVNGVIATPAETLAPELTDSDSGAVLHTQLASSFDAVDAAIGVADRLHASGAWTDLPRAERAAAIRRLMAELTARAGDLAAADSLDTGVTLMWTQVMASARAGLLEVLAVQVEEGFEVTHSETSIGEVDQWRLPWGPAAVFIPWNAPAPTAITKVGEAIAAGCPVILKPSEWAPHFAGPFAEAVAAAGLPDGLVQILHGDRAVGERIVNDPRIAAVSYTGGVIGGTAVAEACAKQLKPVDLELSGNNPVVVLPDADLATVVGQVVLGMTFLNGQVCSGPRRIIVPEDQLETYAAAFGAALDGLTLGASTDFTTNLGPLVHAGHVRHLESQVAELASVGCEVSRHGTLPELGGHFFQPALVKADKAAELRGEIFGPVLQLRTYRDVEEAVQIANDHAFGLSGYVFGADRDAARKVGKRLRAGYVNVNSVLGGQAEVPMVLSLWGSSGIGVLGVGQGTSFFSGYRYVG